MEFAGALSKIADKRKRRAGVGVPWETEGPGSLLPCTIGVIIVHDKSKAGGAVSGHLSTAQAGGSQRTIVRMGLLEEALLSGGARWTDLRSAGLFAAVTEGRIEGLGHDGRGA